jgi:spore coat polysaccharide biosynthesis protein SpsF
MRDTSPLLTIVQARMTSTRLPGKVLMDICGKPALERQIERIRLARHTSQIVIATTVNQSDDPIVQLAQRLAVPVFRGDEMDVLSRFSGAAAAFDAHSIIRLTADCPMLDPEVLDGIITMYLSGDADYVSNGNVRTFPDGLDAEVFTRQALEDAARHARHPFLREHVTPYIRGTHPQIGAGKFAIEQYVFTADFSHVRWTLDTSEDLERIRRLVSHLPERYSWLEALSVATRHPELLGVTRRE